MGADLQAYVRDHLRNAGVPVPALILATWVGIVRVVAGDPVVLRPPVAIKKFNQNRILVDFGVGKRLLPRHIERVSIDNLQPAFDDDAAVAARVEIDAARRIAVGAHRLQIRQKGLAYAVNLLDRNQILKDRIAVDPQFSQLHVDVVLM